MNSTPSTLHVERKFQPGTTDDYEVQYAFAGLKVETQKASSQPTAMNNTTDHFEPDWQITAKGNVLHRSGLGFRILRDDALEEPARESLERWQVYELQCGLSLVDLADRLKQLTEEADAFFQAADAQADRWMEP